MPRLTDEQWAQAFNAAYSRGGTPFCSLAWQSRWTLSESQIMTTPHYVDGQLDYLYTVGPLGTISVRREDIPDLVKQVRHWMDVIEKAGEE